MEVAKRTRLLLLWAITIHVLAVRAKATTSAPSASSTSYPFDLGSDITDSIPSCALSCFESFVEVNFESSLDDELHDTDCHSGFNNAGFNIQCDFQYQLIYFKIIIFIVIIIVINIDNDIVIVIIVITSVISLDDRNDYHSRAIRDRGGRGIAGGFAAAVFIATLALFLFLRRRREQPLTGFSRMSDSGTPRKNHGPSPKISAPLYQEPKSMSFTRALKRMSRSSARPDGIGLAISPEGSGMQGAARQPMENIAALSMPPAAAVGALRRSPSPSSIPPLSPLRTRSNYNFAQPPQDQRRPQPQDQQKPALTLAIPPPKRPQYNRASPFANNRMPFGGGRDSVVTEFAEDGETSAGPGSAQIWRPPNTDPQSSTTYYVADKWGNWVLGGTGSDEQIAELPTPDSKTAAERKAEQERAVPESSAVKAAVKDLSSPTLPSVADGSRARDSKGGRNKSTLRLVPPESGRLPVNSWSSSVYSAVNTNFSMPQTVQPGPENPMPVANKAGKRRNDPSPNPESYYSGSGGGRPVPSRDLTSRPRKGSVGGSGGGSRTRTDTMMSQDSTTTIASSIGSEVGVDSFPTPARQSTVPELQQQGNLSPVVESPGRSPVSYPKIPQPRSNTPVTNNNNANDSNIPGGQRQTSLQRFGLRVVNPSQPRDSPTLGVVDSQKPVQMDSMQTPSPTEARISYYNPPPRRQSSLNPNPNRNPGQVRSGSPETVGGASTSLGRTQVQQQQQQPTSSYAPQVDPGYATMAPRPLQSFQQRISNRSQLPSQSRPSQSRYGPMSVYEAYARPESNYPQRALQPQYQPQQQQQQQQYQNQYQNQYQQQRPRQQQQQQQQQQSYQPYRAGFTPSPLSATEYPPYPSASTSSSSSSSLLAKRLGPERAVAFQMGAPVENPHNASQARWRRRNPDQGGGGVPDGTAGQQPAPTRGIVGPGGSQGQGRGRGRGQGQERYEEDMALPATPGWKPQLTPKRRGGDLYLSVQ
ncbi:hypothetical protein VPNG_08601 [Cytospora leucostoma]|uniref:WW domain-containing protein n=1 Tax=Cytospora leucostoma TaxID=1230097 RepID=A0A423W465_9PEZI|nr:hypothetical protein VPNG_08601 [Cytospora leucostoma]